MQHKLLNAVLLLAIVSTVLYSYFFSYQRSQFLELLVLYSLLFSMMLGLIYCFKKALFNQLEISYSFLKLGTGSTFLGMALLIGIIIRLSIITETPTLSQDFFRFIWDGHQLLNGYNPYLYLPDDVLSTGAHHIPNAALLHANMGALSSGHYTNYAPLNQLFFTIAAFLGGDSILNTIMWMRFFIILADVVVFFIGLRLLKCLGLPLWNILFYFLNPFVIIELTGNLHWEGVMAFFMLTAFYYLMRFKLLWSSLFLGYSVVIKLLPVISIPLLFKYLGFKRWLLYGIAVTIVILAAFIPFFSKELFEVYSASVGLWFGTFEFNASVHYVIRWIGFKTIGYNPIKTTALIMPILTVLIIAGIAFYRNNADFKIVLGSVVLAFFTYLLLSTTVHPWYLTIPLLFSIFTRYRLMIFWSFTVFLSYYAYSLNGFEELGYVLMIEYGLVIGIFIYDLIASKSKSSGENVLV